ncbi:MAG: hypothetical protein ACOH2M_03300 [Cypionkella sp.]
MTSKPAEQRPNGFDAQDAEQIMQRYRDLKIEKQDGQRLASEKYKRGMTVLITEAKNVGMLERSLRKMFKVDDLQHQIQAAVNSVPENEIEVFADLAGQLSFLKPEKAGESDAQIAARNRIAEIQKVTDEEQQAGADALANLTAVH